MMWVWPWCHLEALLQTAIGSTIPLEVRSSRAAPPRHESTTSSPAARAEEAPVRALLPVAAALSCRCAGSSCWPVGKSNGRPQRHAPSSASIRCWPPCGPPPRAELRPPPRASRSVETGRRRRRRERVPADQRVQPIRSLPMRWSCPWQRVLDPGVVLHGRLPPAGRGRGRVCAVRLMP